MKLTDYVTEQMGRPGRGAFETWLIMVWGLWALLVKPEVFWVKGLDEPIEQGTGGGWARRLLISLTQIVLGILRTVVSVLGIALLLFYLALSPLFIIGLRLVAWVIAKRNLRRRAKMLAEARADLTNRVPPQ